MPYASARRGAQKKTQIKSGFHFRARAPDPLLQPTNKTRPGSQRDRAPGTEHSGGISTGTRAVGGQESENRAEDASGPRSLRLAACPGEACIDNPHDVSIGFCVPFDAHRISLISIPLLKGRL